MRKKLQPWELSLRIQYIETDGRTKTYSLCGWAEDDMRNHTSIKLCYKSWLSTHEGCVPTSVDVVRQDNFGVKRVKSAN